MLSTSALPARADLTSLALRIAHDPARWMPVVRFDEQQRWYTRLVVADDHEVWLLSWLPGQRTEIHDHGDSAGANLALVAALRHPGRFAGVALIYPFLDPQASSESYRTAADGFSIEEALWYWEQYAASPDDLTDPDLAPLLSEHLDTLPPTLVVTCEHDPLRDEGEELARRLATLGVPVVATRYLGQLHGIWRHPDAFPSAEPMLRQVAASGIGSRAST